MQGTNTLLYNSLCLMYYRKFECHILYQSNQSTFRILDLNIFLFMEEKKDLKCDLGIL